VVTHDDDTPDYGAIAARLDWLQDVPTEVLHANVVLGGCACWSYGLQSSRTGRAAHRVTGRSLSGCVRAARSSISA